MILGNDDNVSFPIAFGLADCTLKLFHLWNALFYFGTYLYYIFFSVKRFELAAYGHCAVEVLCVIIIMSQG